MERDRNRWGRKEAGIDEGGRRARLREGYPDTGRQRAEVESAGGRKGDKRRVMDGGRVKKSRWWKEKDEEGAMDGGCEGIEMQ